MKRETQVYKGFNIYPEMHYLTKLTQVDKLVFSALYNLTSKGIKPLQSGLHIKVFISILNQHKEGFELTNKINKKDVGTSLFNLTRLGYIRRIEDYTSIQTYGSSQKNVSRPNFVIDTEGHKAIKQAKQLLEETLNSKTLPLF